MKDFLIDAATACAFFTLTAAAIGGISLGFVSTLSMRPLSVVGGLVCMMVGSLAFVGAARVATWAGERSRG